MNGSLSLVNPEEFGAAIFSAAMERSGVRPEWIDEVIVSENYRTGKTASNISRVIALRAGLPIQVPAYTVNMHCGGSLKGLMLASQAIRSGDADAILVGGIELMSQTAYFLTDMRRGDKTGDRVIRDPLAAADPISGMTMGETAEKLAADFHISRDEQDRFALRSQQRAARALQLELFKEEIIPVSVKSPKGHKFVFEVDEHPRPQTTLEDLQKLKPVFSENGSATAGNSCGMSDGASAAVIVSDQLAYERGLAPLARIVSYASAGVEPSIMGIGTVFAARKALQKAELSISDIDLIELNEAFASQCIYFIREMNPNLERLNVNGGAIALGHPIAATGGILLAKLVHELRRRNGRYGLITMCVGGGQGVAMIIDAKV
jgi:acetyl-CoA C-acetyltransferase